jgi:hypothetical protein
LRVFCAPPCCGPFSLGRSSPPPPRSRRQARYVCAVASASSPGTSLPRAGATPPRLALPHPRPQLCPIPLATAATAATAAHRRPRHSPDARATDVRGLAHAPRMRPCSWRCVPGSWRFGHEVRAPRMWPGTRRTAQTYRASRRERGGGGDDRPSENGPQHWWALDNPKEF